MLTHADACRFEDDCRLLLGTKSYELYTLDKVVEKIMGQVQSVTHDASSQTGMPSANTISGLKLLVYEALSY
jgi:histone deacetylase complex regulatory component SIN3